MSNQIAARDARRKFTWIVVAALLLSVFLPILARSNQRVEAATVTDRAVHISTSTASATGVLYEVEFTVPAGAGTHNALVLQYCDDSPIVGDSLCTDARGFDWDETAVTITNQDGTNTSGTTGTSGVTDWTVDDASDSNGLILTSATGVVAGDVVTLTVGNAGVNGVTNPSGTNSAFYIRIHVYDALTAIPCTTNGPTCDGGTATDFDFDAASLGQVHDGGVALSTGQDITVQARVQEVLVLRIGADEIVDDCATFTQTTVDLGVLDSTSINLASDSPATAADQDVICAEVTTNASSGVNLFYIGDNLSIGSTVCGATATDTENALQDSTDGCINQDSDGSDVDANQVSGNDFITAGTEQWGLSVFDDTLTNAASNQTTNFSLAAEYDGNNGTTATNEWTFQPNTADIICSSTTVVNAEVCQIDVAATAAITTPTGLYDTTLTFIATATF